MCLGFFFISSSSSFPIKFLLSFNREENIYRPTKPLSSFEEDENIIGGRDLREKGTWLALNKKTLNIAFLTNFRTPESQLVFLKGLKFPKSRGQLISNFVKTSFFEKEPNISEIVDYLQQIKKSSEGYGPFNLVIGNIGLNVFYYFGNKSIIKDFLIIDKGIQTICNQEMFGLDENERQRKGKEKIKRIIDDINFSKWEGKEALAELVLNKVMREKEVFQNIQYLTTKSTSVVICDEYNQILFQEATYNYNYPRITKYLGLGGYNLEIKTILLNESEKKK
jgi:uncharacterized protein with NRDE domain